ncbi:MAG: CoA activase, partial [Bacteroidia bacterium]
MKEKLNNSTLHLGMDIGSISVNTVLMNSSGDIEFDTYTWCHGRPFHIVMDILKDLDSKYGLNSLASLSFTGSGGRVVAELTGGRFINEVIAQSASVSKLYPDVRTVIEMGGEDSKLIIMEKDGNTTFSRISDFSLNSLCAAGTGSFLDQQAKRIGISIENEFGSLAEKSVNPPRIAGRCSVFAKSDMIHLQQIATPLHDIVAGLCFAVARNFKSTLGRGKKLEKPFIFQGGVAANSGMRRAFRETFELGEDELFVPERHASMGAIGAILNSLENNKEASNVFPGLEKLEHYLSNGSSETTFLEPLKMSDAIYDILPAGTSSNGSKTDVWLGIDVGSLSTNVVLIDKDNRVIARRYLPTAGKPLDAIRLGLSEINTEVGDAVTVKGAGTTGSGRYLTGDFIGADTIRNEITAQATAAIAYDNTVDTIFEIGGQDSKYISISNGVIVDFEMNKVCAAGTGSFLEEQAEKLQINIKEEFGERGLKSQKPVSLGDRCTVFMESDLNSHQQKGAELDNLVGGLAYSIVQNYMQKVVGDKKVGNKIFFQGGVTNNRAVVAAFEKVTGKPITIPPHFDVTGAIGAAIMAREELNGSETTKFKGFSISNQEYSVSSFTCNACSNACEIQKIDIVGENKSLFYGGRCEKYEKSERKKEQFKSLIPNLFEERNQMLVKDYNDELIPGKKTIGIPRALSAFYQQFPFWNSFFTSLGFNVIISDLTDKKIVRESLETMVAETCLPMELMHGHVINLLNKNVDYIFMPFVVNMKGAEDNPTNNCNCPWVQSAPFMVKAAFKDEAIREKFLMPSLHFRHLKTALKNELGEMMKSKFGVARAKTWDAILAADLVQENFESSMIERGREIDEMKLPEGTRKLVLLGRPYNTGDPHLNLNLVDKLIGLGTLPVPIEFLGTPMKMIFDDYYMMYWPNGQKIISAAMSVMKREDYYAVYLGNFRCGPDSFIYHYVQKEMKGKPFLHLEVDEHSADAGLITRCEAFLDSLKGFEKNRNGEEEIKTIKSAPNNDLTGRTLYFPYANDIVHALAAAARSCGIDSEVLPLQNNVDVELGRKHTTGHECFPMICTTGSFLKKLLEPGNDPAKSAFFMPDHNGPCRFGHYNKLQRIIFDKMGFQEATLVTPSNDNAYSELTAEHAVKFRKNAWMGSLAMDYIRKFKQEKRPYEAIKGETDEMYGRYLQELISIIENNCNGVGKFLTRAGNDFKSISIQNTGKKPVVAIVGEVFMRDNPYCSGFLVDRLEQLGAETMVPRFCEWLHYSTYRYSRDSKWKGNTSGQVRAKIQEV